MKFVKFVLRFSDSICGLESDYDAESFAIVKNSTGDWIAG